MEICLMSRRDQTVHVDGIPFDFAEGESIHTEFSHKYTVESFAELAAGQGLRFRKVWKDPRDYFAVLHSDCRLINY